MSDRTFIRENEAARLELKEVVAGLDETALAHEVGPGWTIATTLCHLAFWDQRALFYLRDWERSGRVEMQQFNSQSVEAINQGVNAIARTVTGRDAVKLAIESASAVDAYLEAISEGFADQIRSAGMERYLKRSLHRREHVEKIRQILKP
ncbi:MAG: DinB family protein [Bryobacteraceae bacterium]